ncbi:MAG: SMP-30/gluconolactonase/LRE family protein, partial [Verrucomicrobiales bacterium]|nr:SMP-30/gluconolactonase/LRE family protein [Verrucomicrobiales bacterium]
MNASNQTILLASILSLSIVTGCESTSKQSPGTPPVAKRVQYPAYGEVRRKSPKLDSLIAPGTSIEKLASGFQWSEGPVWLPKDHCVVFSDVIGNTIYKWKEGEGISKYLQPSGYTGSTPRGGEPGSNGLTLDK